VPYTVRGNVKLSVIVPAFNEQAWLPHTLRRIQRAIDIAGREDFELIVVDNASTDRTVQVAEENGARVVREQHRVIGRARNRGAAEARGDVLVFIDADTLVPDPLLVRIREAAASAGCIGGAVDIEYKPRRRAVAWYLKYDRFLSMLTHLTRGATQFCWREVFNALGGYDTRLWIGEDIDFYRRLSKYARRNGRDVVFIDDIRVETSARLLDRWPVPRMITRLNPLSFQLDGRKRELWSDWYDHPIR